MSRDPGTEVAHGQVQAAAARPPADRAPVLGARTAEPAPGGSDPDPSENHLADSLANPALLQALAQTRAGRCSITKQLVEVMSISLQI